jgi:hypothetical protein
MTGPEFTPEQLYERAQGNVTAFVLGTIAFFKEQHRPVEEWVTYIGNRFASAWEQVKGQGAKAALEEVVLNFASAGGSLRSFSGDESKAEAVVTDWPPSDFLELFGLAQEDIDAFYEIFNPIATYLNLQYTWHREGNLVSFTFTR